MVSISEVSKDPSCHFPSMFPNPGHLLRESRFLYPLESLVGSAGARAHSNSPRVGETATDGRSSECQSPSTSQETWSQWTARGGGNCYKINAMAEKWCKRINISKDLAHFCHIYLIMSLCLMRSNSPLSIVPEEEIHLPLTFETKVILSGTFGQWENIGVLHSLKEI